MIIIINKGFSTVWPKSESQIKCYNWDILFIYKCTKDLKLLWCQYQTLSLLTKRKKIQNYFSSLSESCRNQNNQNIKHLFIFSLFYFLANFLLEKKYHVYKYILLSYLLSNHKKQAIICWIIVIIKKRIRTYRWKRKNKSSFIFISLFSYFKAVKGCLKARQRKCTDYYLFCQHSAC